MRGDRCSENIELVRELNLVACEVIDENDLDSVIEKLTVAIQIPSKLDRS